MTRPPDFRILTDRSGTRVEIAIHGELDLATAPQLTTVFERLSELDGIELAVVDLRSLEFLDSTGLEAIMKFEALSRRQGVDRGADVRRQPQWKRHDDAFLPAAISRLQLGELLPIDRDRLFQE